MKFNFVWNLSRKVRLQMFDLLPGFFASEEIPFCVSVWRHISMEFVNTIEVRV